MVQLEWLLSATGALGNYGSWMARCQAHDDQKRSLSISIGKEGQILLHCHAGCTLQEIVRSLGVKEKDLFLDSQTTPLTRPSTGTPMVQVAKIDIEIVEALYNNLKISIWAQDYLKGRGFTGATAKTLRLGCEEEKKRWIAIPHFLNGSCVSIKYRNLTDDDPKYRRVKGTKTILYNQDSLSLEGNSAYIVEGEFDAISLLEAFGPSFPVVAVTAGSSYQLLPEEIDLFRGRKVYVIYDNDGPGQKGAESVARRFSDSCIVRLPPEVKDINELLVNLGPEEFRRVFNDCCDSALAPKISGIVIPDRLTAVRACDFSPETVNISPWDKLNKRLAIEPGHLVTLSADPKIGKTSLALEWMRHCVNVRHERVLFYCLEMTDIMLIRKLAQLEFDVTREDIWQNPIVTASELTSYFSKHRDFWYFSGKFFPDVDSYMGYMRDVVTRHGVEWIVFDHFHKMISSLRNPVQEQANAAVQFKRLAMETGTRILLIVQPRKGGSGDKGNFIRHAEDMAGSHQIRAEADTIITISREKLIKGKVDDDSFEEDVLSETAFIMAECRHHQGGLVKLRFIPETQKFVEEASPIRVVAGDDE